MENKPMTETEAINSAIYNEKLAVDSYQAMGDTCARTGNEPAADFFHTQAKREKGHYNSLMKYKENHPELSGAPVGEQVGWITKEAIAGGSARADTDIDGALAIVEQAERMSERFYREASATAGEGELAELFARLAEDEARHLLLARTLRTKLETSGVLEPTDYDDLGMGD